MNTIRSATRHLREAHLVGDHRHGQRRFLGKVDHHVKEAPP
jgi:hypothetical protein